MGHPAHDKAHIHEHDHPHAQGHDHSHDDGPAREWIAAMISLVLLIGGIVLDNWTQHDWFTGYVRLGWYVLAYLPVGLPVILKGGKLALRGQLFTEFFLMGIATVGAFYIGEFPEAVAVMLFYAIGELFQGAAVAKAKKNIKALIDVRPDSADVVRDGKIFPEHASHVKVGEIIRIKVGDRVPLDGIMLSDGSSFNASALTGESLPLYISREGSVLAGMINETSPVDVKVTKKFSDSSLSRILAMVEHAQGRKAKTELFIRRFAAVYTPVVVLLAAAVVIVPWFILGDYDFHQWLYRALIFLVISCPCALVIAIPLGYFGGIGAGSRNGILFKGSNYLDRLRTVGTIVMDKTGTLTKGSFSVTSVIEAGMKKEEWLPLLVAVESQSNHPLARAITRYGAGVTTPVGKPKVEEIRGLGVNASINGRTISAGNAAFFATQNIPFDQAVLSADETTVGVSVDGQMAGYVMLADTIRDDSPKVISALSAMGIQTAILSGDRNEVVRKVGDKLKISRVHGGLLPEDKVRIFEEIKSGSAHSVAFVGDGINDAPVLAISDVGIAMGGLGADAAIETADVVIQTDQPSKIITAINISKATNRIVWQNIGFAFGVKLIVMVLGVWGAASMWEAVFADVGVALLAILNAIRIQRMKF